MSESQNKKAKYEDHSTSTSDEDSDNDVVQKLPCPFGRVRSDKLVHVSCKDSTMHRRLVNDAFAAWDTRAIIGTFHNDLSTQFASQNGIKDNQAVTKTSSSSKTSSRPVTNKRQTRPVTCVGSVR